MSKKSKAKMPKIKILGQEFDPSKGFDGALNSIKEMAFKPEGAGDLMKAAAFAKRGVDSFQEFAESDQFKKMMGHLDNIF